MHADEGRGGGHCAVWMEEKGFADGSDDYQRPDQMSNDRRATYTHGGEPRKWDLPEEFQYNVWTADKPIQFMDEAADADKPFMIWSSFPDPHPPYIVPEPRASMCDPAEMRPGRQTPGGHGRNPAHFRHGARDPNPDPETIRRFKPR